MDPSSSDPRRIDRVALACVQCRSRHVKCDATQPVCNRCRRDGKECNYQKSRRGGLDKAALAARRLKIQQQKEREQEREREVFNNSDGTAGPSSIGSSASPGSEQNDQITIPNLQDLSITPPAMISTGTLSFAISADRLIDIFYENWFQAYPFVLPQHFLTLRGTHGMDHLLLVMQFVGSVYAPWTSHEPYYETARQALSQPLLPRSGFTIQALLIFSIAQHHLDYRPESKKVLDLAIEISLEMGLNSHAFLQTHGEANTILEESFRRTFYFLILTDQHFAVISNNPLYAMRDVPNYVDLACDDEYYLSGQIPTPVPLSKYEMREFDDEEVIYSSITYMYDIGRVVAHIMRVFTETGQFSEQLVSTADTKIAIWKSMLPMCKRDPLKPDGTVDEVMFMAHMSCSVLLTSLHRPLSSLTYGFEELSAQSIVTTVPFLDSPSHSRSAHTARVLKAAEMQTKLLAIPCAAERHNLFTLCISATLAAAQISACNILLEDRALSIARDRVRLGIGFLSQAGTVWPLAKKMAKELRYIARSTLGGNARVTQAAQPDPSAEIEIPRDDLLWPINPSAQIDIYSGLILPEWTPSVDPTMIPTKSPNTGVP